MARQRHMASGRLSSRISRARGSSRRGDARRTARELIRRGSERRWISDLSRLAINGADRGRTTCSGTAGRSGERATGKMTDQNIIFLLLLGFSLALSFLFSGMESGVFALNRLRIRQLMRAGNPRATVLHGF